MWYGVNIERNTNPQHYFRFVRYSDDTEDGEVCAPEGGSGGRGLRAAAGQPRPGGQLPRHPPPRPGRQPLLQAAGQCPDSE